jgi:hypothetical protein
VYKAVAWTTESEGEKIKLDSYFDGFSVHEHKPRIDYSSLESYLAVWDKQGLTLEIVRKNIINAFLRVLRKEGINDRDNRSFNQRGMIDLLSVKGEAVYSKFKLMLYQWSIGLIRGNREMVLREMKAYIPEFLGLFAGQVLGSREFLDGLHVDGAEMESAGSARTNLLTVEDIEIDVTTVHSVKGQTHTATLYMESFYERGGGGNYESERLAALLKSIPLAGPVHKLVGQSMKMVYVGFSRPTHFLGFAVRDSRFRAVLSDISRDEWEVVEM